MKTFGPQCFPTRASRAASFRSLGRMLFRPLRHLLHPLSEPLFIVIALGRLRRLDELGVLSLLLFFRGLLSHETSIEV